MRGGKDHARATQSVVPDEGPRASGSGTNPSSGVSSSRDTIPRTDISIIQPSDTQPTDADEQSRVTAGSPTESNSEIYQNVLIGCNSLVEQYRKGEITKASAYVDIQSKLAEALENDRARSDAAFGSFIVTIESHDSEVGAAAGKGRAIHPMQRSPSPPISVSEGHQSDKEPFAKRIKVDEPAYAWASSKRDKRTALQDTLSKTLNLIEIYTVDPKATKRSLVNEPDCPEFPEEHYRREGS